MIYIFNCLSYPYPEECGKTVFMDDDKRFGEFWKLCYGSQDWYFSITPRILIESCFFLLLLFYPSGGWGSIFARCFQWLNSNVRTAFRMGKTTEFRKSSKTQFSNQETVSLPQVITAIVQYNKDLCIPTVSTTSNMISDTCLRAKWIISYIKNRALKHSEVQFVEWT